MKDFPQGEKDALLSDFARSKYRVIHDLYACIDVVAVRCDKFNEGSDVPLYPMVNFFNFFDRSIVPAPPKKVDDKKKEPKPSTPSKSPTKAGTKRKPKEPVNVERDDGEKESSNKKLKVDKKKKGETGDDEKDAEDDEDDSNEESDGSEEDEGEDEEEHQPAGKSKSNTMSKVRFHQAL